MSHDCSCRAQHGFEVADLVDVWEVMDVASVPGPRRWYMVVPLDDTQAGNEKQVGQEIVN